MKDSAFITSGLEEKHMREIRKLMSKLTNGGHQTKGKYPPTPEVIVCSTTGFEPTTDYSK